MRIESCVIFLLAVILCQLIPGYFTNKLNRGEESKYTRTEKQALIKASSHLTLIFVTLKFYNFN